MKAFVCVLKSGGDYDYKYVNVLNKALRRTCKENVQLICLTDNPWGVKVPCVPLSFNLPGWWSKLEVFKLSGPCVYLDLDTIILDDITPLFTLLDKPYSSFYGLKSFKGQKLASGIMAWKGDYKWILDEFLNDSGGYYNRGTHVGFASNNGMEFIGDQDYVEYQLKKEGAMINYIQTDFKKIYSYKKHCANGVPKGAKIVCFHGQPRPRELAGELPWLNEYWN